MSTLCCFATPTSTFTLYFASAHAYFQPNHERTPARAQRGIFAFRRRTLKSQIRQRLSRRYAPSNLRTPTRRKIASLPSRRHSTRSAPLKRGEANHGRVNIARLSGKTAFVALASLPFYVKV